jgi:hypothetical protein
MGVGWGWLVVGIDVVFCFGVRARLSVAGDMGLIG